MSTPLSPQAQAVLDAFHGASDGEYVNGVWTPNREVQVAAALRAAADQLVPRELFDPLAELNTDEAIGKYIQRQQTRADLLAMAAELEGRG